MLVRLMTVALTLASASSAFASSNNFLAKAATKNIVCKHKDSRLDFKKVAITQDTNGNVMMDFGLVQGQLANASERSEGVYDISLVHGGELFSYICVALEKQAEIRYQPVHGG